MLMLLPQAALSFVSAAVPRGSLTVVVGAVGAGKSSLLAALAGELRTLTGRWARGPTLGCSMSACSVEACCVEACRPLGLTVIYK